MDTAIILRSALAEGGKQLTQRPSSIAASTQARSRATTPLIPQTHHKLWRGRLNLSTEPKSTKSMPIPHGKAPMARSQGHLMTLKRTTPLVWREWQHIATTTT